MSNNRILHAGRRAIAIAIAVMFLVTALPHPSAGSPIATSPGRLAPGVVCPADAPIRNYAVTSLPIPVAYNHWGDMDLQGEIYVPDSDRLALLDDVGAKLFAAGLVVLGSDVAQMRGALSINDIHGASIAAGKLTADALAAPNDPNTRATSRVDTTDLARPLILRAYIGECVNVQLTNILPAPASIHVHDVVTAPGAGEAVGLDAPDLADSGTVRTYSMYIPPYPGMEGAHFLHSHADSRDQTRHGLFGAIVAEPEGSVWLNSQDGASAAPFGLDAIIAMPASPDFREFITIYHDEVTLVDWTLKAFPTVDNTYGEYGPGSKAIDLRSEPFMDRFILHDQMFADGDMLRAHDKSQSYGSYTYGDPGVIIPKSYLGDPTKFRLINAGPGQYHIHHLHGGGIRWKSTPMAEPSQFAIGFVKNADGTQNEDETQSQRLDVQNMGPGESFTLEPEGGSGGTQQSAGDFLFHCHIVEHYLAGMWSFWRVYNTLQPDLAPLPDRIGVQKEAVSSADLIGHVLPDGTVLTNSNIDAWVQAMLPAKGVPGEDDASVWDWSYTVDNHGHKVYLGEPESSIDWPNYRLDATGRLAPGERPVIGFDPNTAKLSYPLLKPHFGKRPPFAPEHGPAPYLKNDVTAQNPQGLCPAASRKLDYNMVAIHAPVKYNEFDTDPAGMVFVRAQDRAGVEAGTVDPTSIVLRANAGDCVDVTLVNALPGIGDPGTGASGLDDPINGIHWKTNIHIHLVQFDVQASDGVVAGFNYETTIRSVDGSDHSIDANDNSVQTITALGAVAPVGSTVLSVASVAPFLDANGDAKVGSLVGLGLGLATIESVHLVSVDASAGTITVEEALAHDHGAGEKMGYEFVHYRWFPDVDLGTVYFHDHINGLDTWRHGLFGSLVVEPRGSKWLSPTRTDNSDPQPNESVSAVAHTVDVLPGNGLASYREVVLHFQDRACVDPDGDCENFDAHLPPNVPTELSGFNLRSAPLGERDPISPFSSAATSPITGNAQGDPGVVLHAYPGDKVVMRVLYAGQASSRGVATFAVMGDRFKVEQYLDGGRTVSAISMAESSMQNLQLECGAGTCSHLPGDYMFAMTQPEILTRGAWGILRVDDPNVNAPIVPLPSNPAPIAGSIPSSAPVRHYDIAAVQGMVANNPTDGIATMTNRFVLTARAQTSQMPTAAPPAPVVMRASPGDIIEVTLTNMLPAGRVGMTQMMLPAAPDLQGGALGNNGDSTVAPGGSITYRWYADREIGVDDIVSLASAGDAASGLTSAIIVEPVGATWDNSTSADTTLHLASGKAAREHVLLFASQDAQFESSTMPYQPDVVGLTTVNFATEPLSHRTGYQIPGTGATAPIGGSSLVNACQIDAQECNVGGLKAHNDIRNPLNPAGTAGAAPWTPIINATKGQPLVLRIIGASGDQLQTVHLDGHAWAVDPDMDNCRTDLATCRSNLVSTVTVGARESHNVWIPAAGPGGSGDYLYREHRDAFFEAGAWGLLRVA